MRKDGCNKAGMRQGAALVLAAGRGLVQGRLLRITGGKKQMKTCTCGGDATRLRLLDVN